MVNLHKRPATLNLRRVQAEAAYDLLYTRFGTHNLLEWDDLDGNSSIRLVPPYCYRFDEYFGFALTFTQDILTLIDEIFPIPDLIDVSYLGDVLFLLDKSTDARVIYNSTKGLGTSMMPSGSRHQQNLIKVHLWLKEWEDKLNNVSTLLSPLTMGKELNHEVNPTVAPSTQLATKLFINGFNVDKFTQILIDLRILTESRQHTADSKPRNWRAVVEALRENKYLIRDANTSLFKFLEEVYEYPYKIRSIQNSFSIKNLDTQDIYKRANEWCLINR